MARRGREEEMEGDKEESERNLERGIGRQEKYVGKGGGEKGRG